MNTMMRLYKLLREGHDPHFADTEEKIKRIMAELDDPPPFEGNPSNSPPPGDTSAQNSTVIYPRRAGMC